MVLGATSVGLIVGFVIAAICFITIQGVAWEEYKEFSARGKPTRAETLVYWADLVYLGTAFPVGLLWPSAVRYYLLPFLAFVFVRGRILAALRDRAERREAAEA